MPELGKGRCGCSFFYAVINFKEEQMENIIDLKNPRKQKVAWIIHGFAVKVAESHIVTKINFDGEIYQVISAYFQDDCADELIEFKETVSNLCSIEHFYMPMNNSGLFCG